ncbi:hypothetical protein AB1462_28450, partial [Pseudomonas sp. SB113]
MTQGSHCLNAVKMWERACPNTGQLRRNTVTVASGLAPDGHGYLHNVVAANANHDAKRAALDLAVDLDLRR